LYLSCVCSVKGPKTKGRQKKHKRNIEQTINLIKAIN